MRLDSSDKKPAAIGAFLTLAGILAGHTLLETARDALFLARLPASHLAWTYLAIAGVTVAISQAQQRVLDRWSGPLLLSVLLVLTSVVAGGFWVLTGWRGDWIYYLLYVWGGVFSTVVTVQFWLVLGAVYTVTEAKKVYAFVGAGSVVGAIAGALIARAVTHWFDARHLLLASAGVLLLSVPGPLVFLRGFGVRGEAPRRRRLYSLRENLPLLRDDPYLRRVAALVLVSTVAFTLVDYLFKSEVKLHVPAERLGSFFATTNAVLNGASLVAQVIVVPWLIHRLGVTRAVLILPGLFMAGAAAVAVTGGLAAVVGTKGVDGSLRYSLHRTTSELLYVPVSDALRTRVKGLMDGLGQRGGQALGSLVILGCLALSDGRVAIAGLLLALSSVWIFVGMGLRAHYLDLFRGTLQAEAPTQRLELPALDMRSLETFIGALNSDDDAEVLAALELLADQGRVRLIPVLILYHPSREVVLRALEIFAASNQRDFIAPAARLLGHPDPEVRAAALAACCAVGGEDATTRRASTRAATRRRRPAPSREDLLRRALADASPIVSTTALVHLVATEAMAPEEAQQSLERIVGEGSTEARLALVRAIRRKPHAAFERTLIDLARSDVGSACDEIPQAMGEIRSEAFVPALVEMLASRTLLSAARAALVAIGPPALAHLDRMMGDPSVPAKVLRHVPRTISRFDPEAAIPILLAHLPTAPDGMVRYKILRGLGRLAHDAPDVELDPKTLADVTEQTAQEALRALDWRLQLEAGATADPRRHSQTHELLTTLLRDKEALAVERLFRLLGLTHAGEDFERIYRGLRGRDDKVRSSSRELLENLLEPPMRATVIALVDEAPDAERLAGTAPHYQPEELSYEDLLARMLASRSEALRSLAAYHVGEVGLVALRPALEASVPPPESPLASVVARALAMLDTAGQVEVARAG